MVSTTLQRNTEVHLISTGEEYVQFPCSHQNLNFEPRNFLMDGILFLCRNFRVHLTFFTIKEFQLLLQAHYRINCAWFRLKVDMFNEIQTI
jgi:hypothetical protein